MRKVIIFTDLDGTLLDHGTYTFEKALSALDLIKRQSVPLILCSSKTRTEIEHYREKLANDHPFVSENGGGIFLPRGHFSYENIEKTVPVVYENAYAVVRLGARYADLRRALTELRDEGFGLRGFGDMNVEEIAAISGISIEEAAMAKERDFDEPFIHSGSRDDENGLIEKIETMGFHWTKGRFFHILGSTDKGKALSILSELYRRKYRDITTVAVGDSLNDLPMLKVADISIIVRKEDGTYDPGIEVSNLIRADGIGPEGWNIAIQKILQNPPPNHRGHRERR